MVREAEHIALRQKLKFTESFLRIPWKEETVVHRDRLGNWSRALIWLQGPDYCPLLGPNPGLFLACSLDITPWEDIYILWGYIITPLVENAALRRKPQSTFCVSVRPWPHSGIHIWVPSLWTRRTLGYYVWGPSGTSLKDQGSYNLVQDMGHKGLVLRPRCVRTGRARTQIPFYYKGRNYLADPIVNGCIRLSDLLTNKDNDGMKLIQNRIQL
jgi:hypothetical protein